MTSNIYKPAIYKKKEVAEIHHFTYEKNFNANVDAPHYQALDNISKIKTR